MQMPHRSYFRIVSGMGVALTFRYGILPALALRAKAKEASKQSVAHTGAEISESFRPPQERKPTGLQLSCATVRWWR